MSIRFAAMVERSINTLTYAIWKYISLTDKSPSQYGNIRHIMDSFKACRSYLVILPAPIHVSFPQLLVTQHCCPQYCQFICIPSCVNHHRGKKYSRKVAPITESRTVSSAHTKPRGRLALKL